MATWIPKRSQGRLVQPPRYARNGQLVSGAYYHQIARAQNHVVGYRRKWLGGLCQPNTGPFDATVSAATTQWQMYFRTGHGVEKIKVKLLLAPADDASTPASAPIVTATLYDPTTLLFIRSFTRTIGVVDASITDVPDNYIDASGTLAVSDDTAYGLSFSTEHYGRIVAASAWEVADLPVNDTVDGAVDPRYSVGNPILDYQALAMAQGQTELLRSNRRHLISWSTYGALGVTANNTSTYKNIIDGTSTAVSAATPGFYVQNQYCNTLSRTGVPCELAVYASATLNGGTVKITDGTNELETANFTSVGWQKATGLLPAAAATKYDVMSAGNAGGGAVTVLAFALLEYE